jgi:xylulose-5-phosphate/fructose-6-phosphate phosphoketolase
MQNDTIVEGPNPKPLPSHLPEEAEALISVPEKLHVDKNVRDAFQEFRKAANYIAAGKLIAKWCRGTPTDRERM